MRRNSWCRLAATALAVALAPAAVDPSAIAVAPPTSQAARPAKGEPFHPGSPTLHDPSVPGYGNGGYDVGHYAIDVRYRPGSGLLTGRTVITGRMTQNLNRFHLDFALPAEAVWVNGKRAGFTSRHPRFNYGAELIVTPARRLPSGHRLKVVVTYAAKPAEVRFYHYSGLSKTRTGITIWNSPTSGPQWWYPCNDYPSDKARYDIRVTTPQALTAVSNGALVSRRVANGLATAHWRADAPMTTVLSFLTIGHYNVVQGELHDGTPTYTAFEQVGGKLMKQARRDISRAPKLVDFLERKWGPYPFDVSGAILSWTRYGTAFETQTRPTFTAKLWERPGSQVTSVLHEYAHQWFGDSVSIDRWRHVWLAEGFATYSEWVWSQARRHASAQDLFDESYQQYRPTSPFWKERLDHPASTLGSQVYERGAMTLQALRNRVGSSTFFRIMRAWVRINRHDSTNTEDFERLATRLSGQDLTSFFGVWVHSKHRPAPVPRNGIPASAGD